MTLTELADLMGIPRRTLSYYRDIGLFRKNKSSGRGTRPEYDGYDMSRAVSIRLMVDAGFDLKTIGLYVQKYGSDERQLQNACVVASHIFYGLMKADLPTFDKDLK